MKMKLRTRIFMVLALTLMLMLISSLIVFNTFGEQYIENQAQADLDDAAKIIENLLSEKFTTPLVPDSEILSGPLKLIRELIRNRFLFPNENIFIMNDNGFVFTLSEDNSDEVLIANILIDRPELFSLQNTFSLAYEDYSFYVALKEIEDSSEYKWYAVLYVDTSVLRELLRNQGHLLMTSLSFASLLVLLLSYVIIFWLTKPIKNLKRFARRIGEGDFTPDDTQIDDTDLAELHDEMNAMAARLSANEEEQKKFFQNVSHDLRTPLMSIQGYAEGLQYGVFDDNEKPVAVILEESRRMYGMIDNLVYLSYLDSAAVKANVVCDVRESLSRSIEKMQGVAMHDGKELLCDFTEEELPVSSNEESLARVWQNLLSNGLRYCKQQVKITCYKENNWVKIIINDDGQGFCAEDIEHIFQRFYKGKNGNYGLGLSIAHEAISNHHGTITAHNGINGGAEFEILLPLVEQKTDN